jgi:hypothetical protein
LLPHLDPTATLEGYSYTLYTVECSDDNELERVQNEVIVAWYEDYPIFYIVAKETPNKNHFGQSVSWLKYDAVTARIEVGNLSVRVKWLCLGVVKHGENKPNRTVHTHTK